MAQVACDASQAGDLDGAKGILEALAMLNPRDAAIQAALGVVYQQLELLPQADAAYTAAIDRGGHAYARVNRGELRLQQGDARGLADLLTAAKGDARPACVPTLRARALLAMRRSMKR